MTKLFAYGSVVWELFLGLLLKLTLFLHGSKFKWGAYIRVGSGTYSPCQIKAIARTFC
jgi:hypothetical protein